MSYKIRKTEHGFYSAYPLPTAMELEMHYREKYYQNELGAYQHSYTNDELRYFEIESIIAETIFKKINRCNTDKVHSLIDVGAGEGFFSKYFYEQDWSVVTCDFSSDGMMRCNPDQIDTLVKGDIFKTLENQIKTNKVYDFINLKNVLEHVIDPIYLLQRLQFLLKENSVLRVEIPNDYSLFQEALLEQGMTNNTWFSPPEHLHYFNFKNIQKVFKSLDLTVQFMMADFPIELFLLNHSSNYAKNKSVGKNAHFARVKANNFIYDQGVEAYIKYFTASASVNLGRSIILYATKK